MIAKRLELPDLILESFITELRTEEKKTIRGGNLDNGANGGTTQVPAFC